MADLDITPAELLAPQTITALESGHAIRCEGYGRAIKSILPHTRPFASIPPVGASMWHTTATDALRALQDYAGRRGGA
jgi:hypothetical protein